ncbi:MAG: hypothetical protein GYB50_18855 [Rhodobacteraceae bacterium]|nr:hypothetical protein [Paracoccaceae bacterium]
MTYTLPESTRIRHEPDHTAEAKAIAQNLRSFQSGEPLNDWLTEPERATGLLALVLFIGGFLTLAATVSGLGWLLATAIKSAGWDG